MSRSYRKPYSAITGTSSAHDDKKHAARGVRRAQDRALRNFRGLDWDELLIPDRYECSWNETYSWGRDGKQSLWFPPRSSDHFRWHHDCQCTPEEIQKDFDKEMDWYIRLKRK